MVSNFFRFFHWSEIFCFSLPSLVFAMTSYTWLHLIGLKHFCIKADLSVGMYSIWYFLGVNSTYFQAKVITLNYSRGSHSRAGGNVVSCQDLLQQCKGFIMLDAHTIHMENEPPLTVSVAFILCATFPQLQLAPGKVCSAQTSWQHHTTWSSNNHSC